MQNDHNFFLCSQGNVGSMNLSPASGCSPQSESKDTMYTLIWREICSPCTFAYLQTTCHCSASICCMEIAQHLIDRLNLLRLCSSCATEQARREKGVTTQCVSEDWVLSSRRRESCSDGRSFVSVVKAILCYKTTPFQTKFLYLKLQRHLSVKCTVP